MAAPSPPLPGRIETPRLVLQRWRLQDAADLRAALDHSDAHLRPWIPFMRSEPRSLAGTREMLTECDAAFQDGSCFRYALRHGETHALVGETMLIDRSAPGTLEVGYWLDARYCGEGFATEGTEAILPLAFNSLRATRLILRCDERNHASQRVAVRLGASPIGIEDVQDVASTARLVVLEIRAPQEPR